MSLLFNMLSRFVIAFVPRSKCLNFVAAVTIYSDFGAQENEVYHCFHFIPIKEGCMMPNSLPIHGRWRDVDSRVGPRVSVKEEFRQLSP